MRVIYDFLIEPKLPDKLRPLRALAYNLWWSWSHDVVELFRLIDHDLWESSGHNPVLILGSVSQERLEELAVDEGFLDYMEYVFRNFNNYIQADTWFAKQNPGNTHTFIAYFSMEYGLSECMPIYSGGLGVLAGDLLKTASDMGIPMVGVGLLYQQGYFQQYLNNGGWQQESYPINDFFNLPIQPVLLNDGNPLQITVDVAGRLTVVQVWRLDVGRIHLYLLDTNLPQNHPEEQQITNQLYGGDKEMRIRQEIILGIGGIRALYAMGIKPTVCHINEGHAAFAALERIRLLMKETGMTFLEAMQASRGGNIFTTHTPVPAGFDVFEPQLIEKYFSGYLSELGITLHKLTALGRIRPANQSEPFNMAIMATTNSAYINGVSKLHALTAAKMIKNALPGIPENEIPILPITNGVHQQSWVSLDMAQLLDRYLGSSWRREPMNEIVWKRIDIIPDAELWRTHERRRERLVAFARSKLRGQLAMQGASNEAIARADEVLNPGAFTIGFARRFATYKRATLLLSDPNRLRSILMNPEKPVQIIFAGKAHPRDDEGKEFIRKIVQFAQKENLRERIVFLENYNMNIARYLVQGVDVWLNTPRRPLEASGTSGMKVVINGGLNISIPDGWWAEAYKPEVGWAIGAGEEYQDEAYQDAVESQALFDLLEKEIIPLFFDRGRDGLPRGWISRMKVSMRELGPLFNSHRMLRNYAELFYMPALSHYYALSFDNFAASKSLAAWKQKLMKAWNELMIEKVQTDGQRSYKVGESIKVSAIVQLGSLSPEDVHVELFAGPLNEQMEIIEGAGIVMDLVKKESDGKAVYSGSYRCQKSGRYGASVRILPYHSLFSSKHEMGLILWA